MKTFTVLPMGQQIGISPGEVYEGYISVANPADATENLPYTVSVTPYTVVGDDYVVDLVTAGKSSDIVKYIQIENPTGVIKPNEVKRIKFKISLPKDMSPGGQYATLAVGSTDAAGEMVQNVFEIASILFVTVKGEVYRSGKILQNSVPSFSLVNPVAVTTAFSNDGNIHESAVTKLALKNVFTGEVILPDETTTENTYQEYIMPGTTRTLVRNIDGLNSLGIYEVKQTVEYMGETSVVSSVLFVCPVWFLILFMITLAAIFRVGLRKYRRFQRNKRKARIDMAKERSGK